MVRVGIIGGSGLDDPQILKNASDKQVMTAYGAPSSPLKTGTIAGVDVVLLARHGRQHTLPPTHVNYRANIQALKDAGCTHIIATTAVGSLREEIGRGDLVIPDSFIDFTRRRDVSFHDRFEPHKPVHTPMADPFDKQLRTLLIDTARQLGFTHHPAGTVVTIEGSRFSTRAESRMFRQWGADIINMSIAPEAILANEAGMPYAAVAMSTDYDCWKEDEAPVTWEQILAIFGQNVEKVTFLLLTAIATLGHDSIKSRIRTVPHWPKQGIMFRDITTLLKDGDGLRQTVSKLVQRYKDTPIDVVAGIESRGFITGSILAHELGVGFVPIRKKGKLPAKTVSQEYTLEYGTDRIEVHEDAIAPGQNVLLVDDLIATGGTALAACKLVESLGGVVTECCFIVDLPDLAGRKKLEAAGYKVFSLVDFEGD